MKTNINEYSDFPLSTMDGQFQLMVDRGITGRQVSFNPYHTHTCYELFYIAKGTLQIFLTDRILSLSENMLLVIPPDTLHYSISAAPDTQRYSISFRVQDLTDTVFSSLFHSMVPFTPADGKEIENAFVRLHRYYRYDKTEKLSLMAACFYEILYLLKSAVTDSQSTPVPNHMDNEYRSYVIDDYINQHFTGDISLTSLADRVYLSERQVNRILQATYGQSFRQRVIFLRMQNGIRLLLETELTVKEIAAAVGYKAVHGFYRIFEKTYGTTPEQYRKENK